MGTEPSADGKRKRGRPKGSKSSYTTSEKALAQRQANMKKVNEYTIPFTGEEKEYNSIKIQHILKIHEIASHADRNDPESLRSCFINYLILCQQDGCKVGNIQAAASMGVNYNIIDSWLKSSKPEYRELARFIKSTCSMYREEMINDSKINPVIGIFWQRNYDGLRNDTEQVQAIKDMEEEDNNDVSDYRKKYGNLLDE